MPLRRSADHTRIDSGKVAGNPLRPYRQSMLAHGFIQTDESDTSEMHPDVNESLTYSVGPLHRKAPLAPALATLAVLIALFLIAALVFS